MDKNIFTSCNETWKNDLNFKKAFDAERGKLYVMQSGEDDAFKIGRTNRSVEERRKELQTGNPNLLKVIEERKEPYSKYIEKAVHDNLKNEHINGEFYRNINKIDAVIEKEQGEVHQKTYRLPNENGEFDINSDYIYLGKK